LRAHHDRLHDQLVPLISWIRTGGSTSLAIITTGRSGLVHEVEIATERGSEKETRTNVSAKPQVINTRATGTVTGTGTTNTEVKTKKEIERGGVITRRGVIEIDLYLATAGGDLFS